LLSSTHLPLPGSIPRLPRSDQSSLAHSRIALHNFWRFIDHGSFAFGLVKEDEEVALKRRGRSEKPSLIDETSTKQSQSMLGEALDSIDAGLLIVSAAGRISHVNSRFLDIWSIPRERMEDANDEVLLHLVTPQLVEPEVFRAGVQESRESDNRTRDTLRLKDGRIIERSSSLLESSGAEPSRLWLFRDISSRVRAEAALREREAQLSSILRAVPVGIILVVNRTFIELNEGFSHITGYSREECLGRRARFLYPNEEEFEAVASLYRRLEAGESTVELESRWQRKDGALIDVELYAAPLDPRNVSRGATVVVVDITRSKQADHALKASQALLSESQRAAQIGSWELDLATGRLTWTDECFHLYGYPPHSFTPSLAMFNESAIEEDRPRLQAHYEETIASKVFKPFDVRIRRPDGAVRWVHVVGGVLCNDAGVPVRFVGTQMDVTERKQSEQERLELERRLLHAQKLESLGVLASGIAHDFNNLLTAVLGNLELAIMHSQVESPTRPSIEQAVRAAHRAADLTRQILAYSGKARFAVARVNLSALVEENAGLLRASISKLVSIDMRIERNLPLIVGDPSQIQQVIMNLITNASESMEGRPGTITLSTAVEDYDAQRLKSSLVDELPSPGRFVCLEVSDSGCGMDEATLQRLFDPFFTTKAMGRGLGMSAILGIVRGHKGAIFVDSTVARGTAVRVLFPAEELAHRAALPDVVRDDAASAPSPGATQNGKTILVVDDEEIVRTVCSRMLKQLGWSVLIASSGSEAIELLRQRSEELACVILDLSMPHLDGVAVFREMSTIDANLRVILSSGYSSDVESMQELVQEGRAGFLQKPYTADVLTQEISRALQRTS
jgi:two-component system, cell cycle sensor histidine kinase and response regulator CckA